MTNQAAMLLPRPLFLALLCVLVCAVSRPTSAQDVRELDYDLRVDIPLAVAGTTLWVVGEALRDPLSPDHCRWCDDNAFDRGARDALRWSHTQSAATASNWTAYAGAPLVALGGVAALAAYDHAASGIWLDGLIIGEATALAMALNQAIKLAAGRQRPFVHALSAEQAAERAQTPEDNLSFYSGHTSLAVSLAVSAGTVASLRHYRGAPIVWALGGTVALLTGYFRVAADRHYLSDVLTGAVVSGAIGFAVPYLLHQPKSYAPAVAMSASPALVTFTWTR